MAAGLLLILLLCPSASVNVEACSEIAEITDIRKVSIELWHVEPLQVNRFLSFAKECLFAFFGFESTSDFPHYTSEVITSV